MQRSIIVIICGHIVRPTDVTNNFLHFLCVVSYYRKSAVLSTHQSYNVCSKTPVLARISMIASRLMSQQLLHYKVNCTYIISVQ